MGSDPGTQAAGNTAYASSRLQEALANLSLPAITQALDAYTTDLGRPGQEPASVRKAYGDARSQLNQDYETNKLQSKAYLDQQFLQSGGGSQAALGEAQGQVSRGIDQNLTQARRALNFQEAQTGLNQTNQLISGINGVGGNLLSGSLRFGSNALQSDQLLSQISQQNQSQGATYGSIAGTVLGGILGTFAGGNTVLGAGAGGALGGALGGYFGGR